MFLSLCLLLIAGMFVHAAYRVHAHAPVITENSRLVSSLGLTDLCLFTEARYTRHPAVADMNSAFQDYPLSLEHFPSGSIMSPPEHLEQERPHGLD